jgi:glycosyltransferase involved in cell wall biosynthesis
MKIVVAHNRYVSSAPSGENIMVDTEIDLLRAAGVTVLPFIRSSDDIGSLPAAEKALLPVSPLYNRWAARDLAALLDRERPDVVHLHNPYPLISPWVVRVAGAAGVPVVQTVHNYRHDCAAGTYFRDGGPCHDCHGRTYPWPAIAHRCYRGSLAGSAVMATTLRAHRSTWRKVARYLVLSDAMAAYMRSLGIPADRITVKPNCVPDPGPPPGGPGDGFLFAGRLSPDKGFPLLLDAWLRHPDGSLGPLRVAGDGEERPAAERAAAGRTDIELLGRLEREAVHAAMLASAVVVMPSVWEEPFGLVAVEAMARGRPPLVTARGSLPFLVGADAGWVVEPTVDALAAALPVALAGAAEKSVPARQRYLDAYTPATVMADLLKVYKEVCS